MLNRLENSHLVNGSTQIFGGPDTPTANVPAWTIQVPIYGPEKVVRVQMEYAREQFSAIHGVSFQGGELFRTPLSGEARARVRLVKGGVPNSGGVSGSDRKYLLLQRSCCSDCGRP